MMGEVASLHDLMRGTKEKLDVYSYHYYNGISERLASVMPGAHWDPSKAHTEAYLAWPAAVPVPMSPAVINTAPAARCG